MFWCPCPCHNCRPRGGAGRLFTSHSFVRLPIGPFRVTGTKQNQKSRVSKLSFSILFCSQTQYLQRTTEGIGLSNTYLLRGFRLLDQTLLVMILFNGRCKGRTTINQLRQHRLLDDSSSERRKIIITVIVMISVFSRAVRGTICWILVYNTL